MHMDYGALLLWQDQTSINQNKCDYSLQFKSSESGSQELVADYFCSRSDYVIVCFLICQRKSLISMSLEQNSIGCLPDPSFLTDDIII